MKRILCSILLTALAAAGLAVPAAASQNILKDFAALQGLRAADIGTGAAVPAPQPAAEKETAFVKLEKLFYTGVPATWADLKGYHAGRKIHNFFPKEILGALLWGRERTVANPLHNAGPFFPDQE